MKITQSKIYFPWKKELLELWFDTRSEWSEWEYYELWIEWQRMFLQCRPNKSWSIWHIECYPKNELELKIFIRTLIKPISLIVE